MSGVRLLELDSADLVDVLHYMFEADLAENMNEYAEVKDTYRTRIYEDFYNSRYNYAGPKSKKSTFDPNLPPLDDPINDIEPEGFSQGAPKASKGYVPPTEFIEDAQNPYHGVLDAPLN